MYKLLKAVAWFLGFSVVLTPTLLWIYQGFQFDNWQWELSRMAADRIVATVAKAVVASAGLAALMTMRPHWVFQENHQV